MSAKHPVIAVTGSSGAGTTTTSLAFRKIFAQLNLHAAEVEGDSFHRYTRPEMDMAIRKARDQGKHISYFGPEANDFGLLEHTFAEYGQSGKGQSRKYLHTYDEAVPWNQVPGTFTPWQPLPEPTDVLFYEGLHGGVVTPQHNVCLLYTPDAAHEYRYVTRRCRRTTNGLPIQPLYHVVKTTPYI